jgi:hypothetical protein
MLSTLLSSMTTLDPELSFRVLAYRESIPTGLAGCYVALTGADRALQIGFLSDMLGWQSLSEAHDPDPALSRQRVVEVSSELVLRLARAFRRRWADEREVTIGLPLFVEGGVALDGRHEVQAADIALGATRALLVVLTPRPALAAATLGTDETPDDIAAPSRGGELAE